jgi:Holliday junction resolvase
MNFSRYRTELELREKFEKRGYLVMKVSGNCNLLIGGRREIFVILLRRTRNSKVTISKEKVRALIDLGERFFAIPLIAVKFLNRKWVIKEVTKPEKLTIRVDDESDLKF